MKGKFAHLATLLLFRIRFHSYIGVATARKLVSAGNLDRSLVVGDFSRVSRTSCPLDSEGLVCRFSSFEW